MPVDRNNAQARERNYFNGFIGDRPADAGGGMAVYVVDGAAMTLLDPRHDLRNHSPDGFQWGYGGSGPAQLALAICCNVVGDKRGQRVYQDFKFRVIAGLDDSWEITRADALRIIEQIESGAEASRKMM